MQQCSRKVQISKMQNPVIGIVKCNILCTLSLQQEYRKRCFSGLQFCQNGWACGRLEVPCALQHKAASPRRERAHPSQDTSGEGRIESRPMEIRAWGVQNTESEILLICEIIPCFFLKMLPCEGFQSWLPILRVTFQKTRVETAAVA